MLNIFSKKKKSDTMPVSKIKTLNKKELRYVAMRDPETYKEIRLGTEGAINITDGEIRLVCLGDTVFACKLDDVKVGELMSLDGIPLKGFDRISGEERSVTAFYLKKD